MSQLAIAEKYRILLVFPLPFRRSPFFQAMFRSVAAVVGTGFIGPVHIEGLLRAGVRVQGVLGTSVEKSRHTAQQFGLQRAYASFGELLDDSEVDCVHLTSPNRFHFEQAIQCLDAGKHVLCEKPLAMNSAESRELVRRAKIANVLTAVNYNVRFYPVCIEAAQLVERGDVGDVFHVTGSYVQDWLHKDTDFNWRVLANEGGALRALADIGTHWLDLVQTICKLNVQSVCADLQTVYPVRHPPLGTTETFSGKTHREIRPGESTLIDTEDFGSVLLRFHNGARGVMHVSQVSAGHKNTIRWEIAGSKQCLAWNSQHPDELWIGHRDEPNQTLLRDPGLLSGAARAHAQYPGGHNEGFPDTFKQLFRSFYSAIESRVSVDRGELAIYPTFEDGHREILMCEAILKSAREHRWVDLDDA
ncbi:MAG: Gfo/Idh/MocA family oxidoreductase [Pirellula sp.]